MLKIISLLQSNIIKYIGLTIGILVILFKTRQSGKDSVKVDILKETVKGVEIRDEIKNNISSASNIERKRLRKKWNRD